jgi:lysophospholipase L1-like esterase
VALLSLEFVFRTQRISTNLGLPSEIAAWQTRYDRLWESNVFGFRSRHEELHKEDGVFRIVALGDSFTWGDKIAETDSTWPAILETTLTRDAGSERIEVISMAQRGYTTANEAELLQRLGWQFDPDLVVIQFFANDGLPSGPDFQSVGGEWLCPQRSLVPARFRTELLQRSAIIAFLEVQYNALRSSQPCYLQFHQLYDSSSATFAQFHSALGTIGDSARARGTPIVMLLFPFFAPGEWTRESYPLRQLHEQVAALAQQEGLRVVDLVPYFAAEGGDWRRWWATQYDSHPNSRAHQLVADVLADSILGNGFLAQPPRVRVAAPR